MQWPTTPRATLRPAAVFAAGLLLLGAALAWLERQPALRPARLHNAARDLPASAFPSRDALLGLRRLGLLHALPPGAEAAGAPDFGRYRLTTAPPTGEELARSLAIPSPWLARPVAVASLLVDPAELARLNSQPEARGRDWEIPGFFAWVESGRLRFSSPVGVRLHGGWTREFPEVVGYRLYFRRRQDAVRFPAELMPDHRGPDLSRLVLRHDGRFDPWGRYWMWETPLTSDIARRVGSPVPHARPVRLFLNGQDFSMRTATEHLSQDYFREHYGHQRFSSFDVRGAGRNHARHRSGDPDAYRQLSAFLHGPEPLTLSRLAQRVDVDNLMRWYATVLVCGTADRMQGLLARPEATSPPGKWFWIAWDIDQSFGKGVRPPAPGWERDSFVDRNARISPDLRAHIFRRLRRDDPQFPAYFAGRLVEVLNHRVTDGFLIERLAHYRHLAAAYRRGPEGEQALVAIEEFLMRRKPALRRQLAKHLAVGPAHQLRASAPPGRALVIDGYRWPSPYRGWYFAPTPAQLEVAPEDRASFSHWRVDGEPRPRGETRLRLELSGDRRVEAVFAP